jgi:SAM-dependent methyltransferase
MSEALIPQATTATTPEGLQQIYQTRFQGREEYRLQIWKALCSFFSRWIQPHHVVCDVGSGYGEFINSVSAARKYAIDLNPDARHNVNPGVKMLQQDCSAPWDIPEASLDVVFTSNFLEHLPNKTLVEKTIQQARRCLKPGGVWIAMGPNVRYLAGSYWDFFDHYTALTEHSLSEVLTNNGFRVEQSIGRFLPYTMVGAPKYPVFFLRAYLAMPFFWRCFGAQFLVVARKP